MYLDLRLACHFGSKLRFALWNKSIQQVFGPIVGGGNRSSDQLPKWDFGPHLGECLAALA